MSTVIGVVVLLGGLIFFHELGHYLIAKLFRVKVEVFSLGFGKKLLKRKWGETEYCISLVPLGGYVKLMGDDPYKGVPPEEAHRAFATQKLHKRFLIVAAGPIFNLILAYFLLVAVFWFGQPMTGTRVGSVTIGSPGWEAGIRAGDHIMELQGISVRSWNELEEYLKDKSEQKIEVRIQREDTQLLIPVLISKIKSKNIYGEDELVGAIKGISPNPLSPTVAISDPKTAAYLAGLRTGDGITRIHTRSIEVYEDINEVLREHSGGAGPITFTVKRATDPNAQPKELSFSVAFKPTEPSSPLGISETIGLYPSELAVKSVNAASPAEKGGLMPGDRIAKVGDRLVYNFETIVEYVQEQGANNQKVNLLVEREGKKLVLSLDPVQTQTEDPLTRETVQKYLVGFVPNAVYHEPEIVKLQIRQPIALLVHSFNETTLMAERMVVSIFKLIGGKISVKNLGGPVLIASVAGKSLDAGIVPFLQMMALISINLFLLNLFPIPVLDGGHLLFFFLEAVKGKPVSLRTMEIANQVGMFFILLLVGLTLFNDISRMVLH